MNDTELAEWLGVPLDAPIREAIRKGMAEVGVPGTDEEHVEAFKAFLKCAGKPNDRHRNGTYTIDP